jgi:hypothetical protein
MIDNQEWNRIKQDLISRDVMTKTVTLPQIDVTTNGIRDGYIKVQGNTLPVSRGFFSKLAKTVNVNSQLATSFMKNDDEQIYATLIKAIKQYKSIRAGASQQEYQLIADPVAHEVVNIVKGSSGGRLSMSTICDISERILNDNPDMALASAATHRGETSIHFINNKEIKIPGVGADEEFNFGFTINTTPTSTGLELYNHRLVCSNGMRMNMGRGAIAGNLGQITEGFSMRSLKAGSIDQFLNQVKRVEAQGFIPQGFKQAIKQTQSTRASFSELEGAIQLIMQEMPDQDSAKDYRNLVANYFPAYASTVDRIKRHGVDILQLNQNQKSNIKTGMSVWDVVNNLTFLGSNRSEFQIGNREGLKSQGGKLLDKALNTGLDLQYSSLQQL